MLRDSCDLVHVLPDNATRECIKVSLEEILQPCLLFGGDEFWQLI